MREDWNLVESSLAKQYGIRIRSETDMAWDEFCSLISGLMPDTPLGQIVSIRAEKDPKVIKSFSKEQRRIHYDWKKKAAQKSLDNPEQLIKSMKDLETMLSGLFGKKG